MIKIEDALSDALTLRIAEGLKSVEFLFFGISPHDFSWANKPDFPLPQSVAEKMTAICGDHGTASFLYGEVSRALHRDPSYEPGKFDKLTDFAPFEDQIAAGREIVSRLKLLPYKYRSSVPLPKSLSKYLYAMCDDFDLGTGVSIQSGAKLSEDFPISTEFSQIDEMLARTGGDLNSLAPQHDTLYLVQKKSGYVSIDKESPVIVDFRSSLRQFLGIALAVGALNESWPTGDPTASYVIHRVDDDTQLVGAEKLPQQILSFYSRSRAPDAPKTAADKRLAEKRLDAMKSAFSTSDHGKRLSVAAIWYLRSVLSQDTLDGLLEATIAMEALYGGGSQEGTKISSLLANRCAYRIGKSVNDRNTITEKFLEIYNLRSRIVHEGHHKFTARERALLKEARDICRRSLALETVLPSE